jgi:homoserine dehydrogenase
MVVTSGRFGGDVVFSGHGAGGHPTAVAVMSDVRAIAENSVQVRLPAKKMAVVGDVIAPYYLRFVVDDKPGIVAAIASELAKVGANIDSILQHRGFGTERLPFVVTTEPCLSSKLGEAIAEMAKFDFMLEPPLCLQILVVDDPETD